MTLDQAWTEGPSHEQDQTPPDIIGLYKEHPLHVSVVATETENVAPEFAGWATWLPILAGSGNPTQLLQRRIKRFKAYMIFTIPANTTLYLANTPNPLANPVPPSTTASLTGPLTGYVFPNYEAQQPVYAVYTGTGPVSALVLDESYGEISQ